MNMDCLYGPPPPRTSLLPLPQELKICIKSSGISVIQVNVIIEPPHYGGLRYKSGYRLSEATYRLCDISNQRRLTRLQCTGAPLCLVNVTLIAWKSSFIPSLCIFNEAPFRYFFNLDRRSEITLLIC